MVKRKILEKMSNEELLSYIRPESRFTYEAIKIAYEIIKKRDVVFSNAEEQRIILMMNEKKEKELHFTNINKWDINNDEKNSSVTFFSQKTVWFFSLVFGIHVGAIILAINLFTVSKKANAWLCILFGFLYTTFLFASNEIVKNQIPNYDGLIFIILTCIGATILQFYFWDKFIPNNLKYKKRGYIIPLIICLMIYLPLVILVMIKS